jgi:hypothetical protein
MKEWLRRHPNENPSGVDPTLWQLRNNVVATPGKVEAADDVGKKVMEFRSLIERSCSPIVDREFRS